MHIKSHSYSHDEKSVIMGKRCLEEWLRHASGMIVEVRTSLSSSHPLVIQMVQKGIKVVFCSKSKLDNLVQTDSHQGIVAYVFSPRTLFSWKDFTNGGLLLLDRIYDPQNVGALIRSAECFGISGIVISKNRGCSLTPVVAKASVGANALVPVYRVANLATFVKGAQQHDCQAIATVQPTAPRAVSLYRFEFPKRFVLMMGSEGTGLQPLLIKKADVCLTIPMHGKINSLNVSQAATVCLSHWRS